MRELRTSAGDVSTDRLEQDNAVSDAYALPTSIQPHGVLIAVDEADLSILQVSTNTPEYLGYAPKQLIGNSLDTLLDLSQIMPLVKRLSTDSNWVIPFKIAIKTAKKKAQFNGFIHRLSEVLILEFEPARRRKVSFGALSLDAYLRHTLDRIQQAKTLDNLLTLTVHGVQELTGFDRVMVYQFDHQGAGEVIAEATQVNVDSYLGLHFPARDIPAPTRDRYAQGKLRSIPNIPAPPVVLIPEINPKTLEPLDLSHAVLRHSAPCSIEYYNNMGVSAALVASLIKDSQLWGIISCHHFAPKILPYEVRSACHLLAQMAGAQLARKIEAETIEQKNKINALKSELLLAASTSDNFIEALIQPRDRILDIADAQGAAIILGDTITLVGTTPTEQQVQSLTAWLHDEVEDNLFQTNCLSPLYPEAADFKDIASGLLCLQISQVHYYYILWFRPEVLQSVSWGGNPQEGISIDEQGNQQLTPRTSFERWTEMVYATALPWKPFEISSVLDLRNAIVGIILKKADELAQLNLDLKISNRELASFSYAAAHDLKEPLRGIHNYASILIEDYAPVLDEEGVEYLTDIRLFTQRMETLISSLLRMGRLRQTPLQIETIDMNDALAEAVEIVRASRPQSTFELRLPRRLPLLQCDPALFNEVLQNLISNAVKYNEQSHKWVEVGYVEPKTDQDARFFYVKDNGIGIQPDHTSRVFELFKRLHSQEQYEGGAGVGLSIVQQIIERHKGEIWIKSNPGEGSSFCFTLDVMHQAE